MYFCFEKISESVNLEQYVKIISHKTANNDLPESKVRDIFIFIGRTLEQMHNNGIMVRNLDFTNILMTSNNEDATPKINNLDKAIVVGIEETVSGLHGDFRFKAPEVI